jgi:hypothetical protein
MLGCRLLAAAEKTVLALRLGICSEAAGGNMTSLAAISPINPLSGHRDERKFSPQGKSGWLGLCRHSSSGFEWPLPAFSGITSR